MSKNLHEPSTPRAVATNRYTGKLTQQKPYAFEWVTPVNAADCATAQAITPWIPCYLNDWEQPTTLEPLSVRMNADGLLQWQGYVNSAIATSAIAFIMPGTLGGEPDMIPPDVPGNLSYNVFVTPDDGTTITTGRAYVDSTTGEVTITSGTQIAVAWMIHFGGSSAVPIDTAYDITSEGGAGNNPYDTGFVSDPNPGGFSLDLANGVISWDGSAGTGNLFIHGSLQVNDDLTGGVFSPLLDFGVSGVFGGGDRTANIMPGTGTGTVFATNRFGVSENVHTLEPITTKNCVRLLYLETAVDPGSIESLQLTVYLMRSGISGTVSP